MNYKVGQKVKINKKYITTSDIGNLLKKYDYIMTIKSIDKYHCQFEEDGSWWNIGWIKELPVPIKTRWELLDIR